MTCDSLSIDMITVVGLHKIRYKTFASHFRKCTLTHLFNVKKHWGKPFSWSTALFFLCVSDNMACNTISVSTAGAAEDARHLSWETISCELQRRTMMSVWTGGDWSYSHTIDLLRNKALNYITCCALRIPNPHRCPTSPNPHIHTLYIYIFPLLLFILILFPSLQ